jgi:hypothetical protein
MSRKSIRSQHLKLVKSTKSRERRTSGACMALENLLACLVTSSRSVAGREANISYFVPIRTGIAVYRVSAGCMAGLRARTGKKVWFG